MFWPILLKYQTLVKKMNIIYWFLYYLYDLIKRENVIGVEGAKGIGDSIDFIENMQTFILDLE